MEVKVINEQKNTFEFILDSEELELLVSYAVNDILRKKILEVEEEKNDE